MQEENKELINSFMDHTLNKEIENFDNLELYVSPVCNQSCKYCYIENFGDELYPDHAKGDYVENVKKAMKYLPDTFNDLEIFSGEPLIRDDVFEIIEYILETDDMNFEHITIPTNGTFILNEGMKDRVIQLIKKGREKGTPILPSLSVDGKYCQDNRPMSDGSNPWNDKDWENLFEFAKKWRAGFHPMIYSERIEKWKKNWKWFQKMFRKYDIPFYNIYLLEIRNVEWSERQMKGLYNFMKFLIEWTYEKLGKDKEKMIQFLFDEGYNILRSPLSNNGRGIGCSIQSTFDLRLGDLAWVPCHRTSYDQFVLGHLTENGIDIENPELAIQTFTFNSDNFPYCENCPLKSLCSKGCLGAQYEVTGDMFTPIPTVCKMQHYKIAGMIHKYEELGILDLLLDRISNEKSQAIRNLKEENIL